jgi:hypothetical protein
MISEDAGSQAPSTVPLQFCKVFLLMAVGFICAVLVYYSLVFVGVVDDTERRAAILWALPALLFLVGAGWAVDKRAAIAAVAAVFACAVALLVWTLLWWLLPCPDCVEGEFSRSTYFGWTVQGLAILTTVGVAIVAFAAALSVAVRELLSPRRQR